MAVTQALHILKALADDTRLRLFHVLSRCELNVNEIVRVLDMGQSRVSRHLRILTEAGLLAWRREGLWVYYAAAESAAAPAGADLPEEVRRLLAAVRELDAGDARVREDQSRAREALLERRRHTQRFFDSIAGDWDELKKAILGDFDLNRAIVELLPPPEEGRRSKALEVGCGTGDLLDLLREAAGSAIGVDSSPGMLEVARRRFRDRTDVDLRLGEAEHLPLRDGEADLAVMSLVLHHLSRPEEGIREVARVLHPGRRFLVADLDRHGDETLRERFGDRWLGFDAERIAGWLREAGFHPAGVRQFELRPGLSLSIHIADKTT